MGKFEKPRNQKPAQAKPTAAQKHTAKVTKASQAPKAAQTYKAAPAAKPAKKKGGNKGKIAAITVATLAALVILGGLGYALMVHSSGDILPGVSVAGVDVGGMSREEAKAAVQQAVNATYGTETLTVTLPDRTLSFAPADTKASVDVDKAVEAAWNYGRDGGIFQTLKQSLTAATEVLHTVDMGSALSIDEEYIRSTIDATAAEVKSERKDSTYEVVESEVAQPAEGGAEGETVTETIPTEVIIHVGTSERSLDADGLYDAVMTAYMNNDFTPLEYNYEETRYTQVDLDALYKEMCTDMADAYYDKDKKEIVDEVEGYGFDLAAAKQKQDMAEEGTDLSITLSAVEPEVTRAKLEETLFHDVLGSSDTPYPYNPGRTTNLDLACKAIDGTILNPGDVFSFNDIVGERTAAKGYQAAIAFVNGTSTPEVGGGICQVASTIYHATLLADLNIVERLEHMYTVDYVPLGMDATIYWGSNVDFKFSNSTNNPIRIDAYLKDGKVHIGLVGTKESEYTVKLDSKTISTTQWKDVTQVDETKPADYKQVTVTPYTGYKTVTYKQYIDADGNPVSDWEKVQFPNSTYQKRDRVTVIGKQEEEKPEEPTTPTDPNNPTDPGTGGGTTTDPGTGGGTTTDPGTGGGTTTDPGTGTTTPTDPGTGGGTTTDPGTGGGTTTDPGTGTTTPTDPGTGGGTTTDPGTGGGTTTETGNGSDVLE